MMKKTSLIPLGSIIEYAKNKGSKNKGLSLSGEDLSSLIEKALKMRSFSYCPYSGYAVGAAVLTDDDSIYGGCNIENASYGATVCAERTAIFKAVSEGHKKIKAIAICGAPLSLVPADKDKEYSIPSDIPYAYPCGICRQVISEFAASPDIPVIVCRSISDYESHSLSELIPYAFTSESM